MADLQRIGEKPLLASIRMLIYLAVEEPAGLMFGVAVRASGTIAARSSRTCCGSTRSAPPTGPGLAAGRLAQRRSTLSCASWPRRGCSIWRTRSRTPRPVIPAKEVELLAGELSVDLAAAWQAEKCGPLTERYFELHNKGQLAELAKTAGVHVEENQPKPVMIKLLTDKRPFPLPKELAPGESSDGEDRGKEERPEMNADARESENVPLIYPCEPTG